MSTQDAELAVTQPSSGDGGGDPQIPALERYELLQLLGEGGMGAVWEAHDRTLDRKVAFKVLHDQFLGAGDQERLAAEARAMARLSDPHVVAVYDVGERAGRTFVTMELVRGLAVSRWLETPRAWPAVVEVFRAAGEGLAAAHEAGIIHRDVKPSNILLGDDGRVRVADFGVAHAGLVVPATEDRVTTTTNTAGVIGSPAYMAPERLRGETADARGDQFGFAVSLYEVLEGRRPFSGDTLGDLIEAIDRGAPPHAREIPRWLAEIVARGLAAQPADRFPSMRALLAALRRPRRRRWIAAALGGAAVTAVTVSLAVASGEDAPSCGGARGHLAGIWDAPVSAQLAAAFADTGLEFAGDTWREVARSLDGYADQWATMHEASCRATHVDRTQSAALLERRQLCLDRRRGSLQRVIRILGAPDERIVESAPAITRGLEAVADCADPGYLATPAAARPDLALARVHLYSSSFDEGRQVAARVVADAREAGDRGLEAEALVVRGMLENSARAPAEAIDTLRSAAELAGEVGAIRLRGEALTQLGVALQAVGRLPEAETVLDLADATLREHSSPLALAHAASARGTLLGRQTRFADATVQFELALDRFTEVYGPASPAYASTLRNLSLALRRQGRADAAREYLRRARELTAVLGADHPEALRSRREHAIAIAEGGGQAEALAELQAIHEARLRRHGDDHEEVAVSHSDLGVMLSKLHRLEEALVAFRASLAIRERLGPERRETLTARANVADTLTRLGLPESEPVVREVLAARQRMHGRAHADVALGYTQLGSALSGLGRPAEAVAAFEEARAIYSEVVGPEHELVAKTLRDQAAVERHRGRFRTALALDTRALALRVRVLPATHPARIGSLVDLAIDHLALRQDALAATRADEAIEALGDEAEGPAAAEARWLLAQALDRRRLDPARARALALDARTRYAELPGPPMAAQTAVIDAWLAARAPPIRSAESATP